MEFFVRIWPMQEFISVLSRSWRRTTRIVSRPRQVQMEQYQKSLRNEVEFYMRWTLENQHNQLQFDVVRKFHTVSIRWTHPENSLLREICECLTS